MDWPGAQEIAERLKKTLPPGIADDPKDKDKQIPPQVQAQMQQMSQLIEQLTGKLNEATEDIDKKKVEFEQKAFEIESKERIEMQKIQADIEIELAKLSSKEGVELLKAEIAEIQGRLALLNYDQPIESGNEPEAGEQTAAQPEFNQPTGGLSPGQPPEGGI